MTRQVTDDLYVDLDYFEPEDYYVYVAQAAANMAVTVSMTAALSELAQVPRQDTDDLYVDLDYYQPEDYYVYVAQANSEQNAVSSLTAQASVIKTTEVVFNVNAFKVVVAGRLTAEIASLDAVSSLTATAQRVSRPGTVAEAGFATVISTEEPQFGQGSAKLLLSPGGGATVSQIRVTNQEFHQVSWTVDYWQYNSHWDTDGNSRINLFRFGPPFGSQNDQFILRIVGVQLVNLNRVGTFRIIRRQLSNSSKTTDSSQVILPTNVFNHFRIVHELTSSGGTTSVYFNGVRIIEDQGPGQTSAVFTNTLGRRTEFQLQGLNATSRRIFLDEALIHSTALTPSTVSSFTPPTAPNVNTADTRLLLHLDTDFVDDNLLTDRDSGAVSLNSVSTLTAVANKFFTASLAAELPVSADLSAEPQVTASLAAELPVSADLSAEPQVIASLAAELSVAAFKFTTVARIVSRAADLAVNSTLFAQPFKILADSRHKNWFKGSTGWPEVSVDNFDLAVEDEFVYTTERSVVGATSQTFEFFVTKRTIESGNIIWRRSIGNLNASGQARLKVKNGFVYLLRQVSPPGSTSVLLVKLDSDGFPLWQRLIPADSGRTELDVSNDAVYVVSRVGSTDTNILKIDFDGNTVWSRQYTTTDIIGGNPVTSAPLSVKFRNGFVYVLVSVARLGVAQLCRLVKINSAGTTQSVKTVGDSSALLQFEVGSDDSLYFASQEDNTPLSENSYLTKYDQNNNRLWSRKWQSNINAFRGIDLVLDQDDNLYIIPTVLNAASNFIISVDSEGTIRWTKKFLSSGGPAFPDLGTNISIVSLGVLASRIFIGGRCDSSGSNTVGATPKLEIIVNINKETGGPVIDDRTLTSPLFGIWSFVESTEISLADITVNKDVTDADITVSSGTNASTVSTPTYNLVSAQEYTYFSGLVSDASLESKFTIDIIAGKIHGTSAILPVSADLSAAADNVITVNSNLTVSTQISVSAEKNTTTSAVLQINAVQDTDFDRIRFIDMSANSDFDVDVTAQAIRNFDSNPTAVFDQTVDYNRIRSVQAEFDVIASKLSVVARVGDGFVAMDVVSAVSADAEKITDTAVLLNSVSALQAAAARTVTSASNMVAEFTVLIAADKIKLNDIDMPAQFEQTCQAAKIARAVSEFSTVTDIDIVNDRIRLFQSQLEVQGNVDVEGVRVGLAAADFDVSSSMVVTAFKTFRSSAVLNVQAFKLTVGSLINIDPFYTFTVPSETGELIIASELRQLTIEQETRKLTL